MDCEHMVTFPRIRECSKYLLVVEHLENDLRSIGVTNAEIKRIESEANKTSGSLISALRSAYKEHTK